MERVDRCWLSLVADCTILASSLLNGWLENVYTLDWTMCSWHDAVWTFTPSRASSSPRPQHIVKDQKPRESVIAPGEMAEGDSC